MAVGREGDKRKFLEVPDCLDEDDFKKAAGLVWQQNHPDLVKIRGPRSTASRVFQLCQKVAPDLMERRMSEQLGKHQSHNPKDDTERELELLDNCPECKKKPVSPLSLYAFKETIVIDEHSKLDSNTLYDHIEAWLHFQFHPDWLEKGIPSDFPHKFKPAQKKAFEKERRAYLAKFDAIETLNVSEPIKKARRHRLAMDPFLWSLAIQEFCVDPLGKLIDR